ncbi:MAG: UDP-N-acetylmuramoyl-L-alanine--D-glutamate ligase [Zetaproteobacteria bacterium]|nr:MAG: UDP-N-acetylmuramoyl-L-alanine--D-glutamate ligase [Zetaproteobacteria bacterium]
MAEIQGKVAVVGMGKTGLSVVRHLQRLHIDCECFDEAAVQLPEDLANVLLHTGVLQSEVFLGFEKVIVSPGIDWRHPALVEARKCGVEVHGDLDEFLANYSSTLIAVTGTNGKTTATQMIALLLETLPKGCDAGGNIGVPMLDLLADGQPERVALELSSFQLERAKNLHPNYAVLLNVQADHADMHASLEAYRAAKVRMFQHMVTGDTALLLNTLEWDGLAQDLQGRGVTVKRFGIVEQKDTAVAGVLCGEDGDAVFWHQGDMLKTLPCASLMVRGRHQQQNIAVAAQVAADFGVSAKIIEEALMSFQGLEHRLEFVGHIQDRDWFNDSKATNPNAAVAALTSFAQVVWICGGVRKDLALDELVEIAKKHVCFAYVIGENTKEYEAMLSQAGVSFVVSTTMGSAVRDAAAHDSDCPVLLSPAAASQDQYRHYAERGADYIQAIRALGGES